jgi:ABC-type transport system substrate-binding protein
VAGSALVPDLAVSLPTPTDNGGTYIFHIRSGIRYSNGVPLRASDFARGIKRAFEVGNGPVQYFTSLVGGARCLQMPPSCDRSRGVVADDAAGTVAFHLVTPDPDLLNQLTLPDAYPVPPGTPVRLRTPSVPGTGPYQENVSSGTGFLWLNTRTAPFDSILARQAHNYAVNRAALAGIARGTSLGGRVTCQLLPPNFPGNIPYCPYTVAPSNSGRWLAPDLTRARALVRESGTLGMRVALVQPSDVPAKVGQTIGATLHRIGYRPRLAVVPVSTHSGPNQKSLYAHYQVGVGNWFADCVSSSDFLALLVTSSAISQAYNLGRYCSPALDARVNRALAEQAAQAGTSSEEWTAIDRMVVDDAGDVPLNNPVDHDFVARRIGNYQYNPQWGALVDQLGVR